MKTRLFSRLMGNSKTAFMIAAGTLLLALPASLHAGESPASQPAVEAVNLLENYGAETQITAAQAPFDLWYLLNNDFLELADSVPEGWGAGFGYTKNDCGQIRIAWGSTGKEAHSGRYSCFLKVLDRQKTPDTDEMNARVFLGKTNGRTGEQSIEADPGKEYFYSLWIKGDVEAIDVRVSYWSNDGRKSLWGPPPSHSSDMVGEDWKQISGTFKPPEGAKRMAVSIGIIKAKAGQAIYVDDALVGLNSQTTRALAENLGGNGKGNPTDKLRESESPAQKLRVLFIGNSQMESCQLPWMIKLLSKSAPADCPRIDIGQVINCGTGVKGYWDLGDGPKTPRGMITKDKWDYVVIQPAYHVTAEELETYVALFDGEIRRSGAKTILFATASVSKYYMPTCIYPDSFCKLNDMHIAFGKKHDVRVAAAGYAWIRYLGLNPPDEQLLDMYHKDKGHPGHKGSYIYACSLYATITGKSPVGLVSEFLPIPPGVCIGKKEAALMQQAAWEQYQENLSN